MSLLRTFSTLSSLYLITIWSHHADIDITWPISFSIIDNSHRSRMEHGTLIRISDIWYIMHCRFVWCHDLTCLPLLSISLFIPPIKRSKLHYLALVTQWNSNSSLLIIEVKIFLLIQEVAAASTFACSLTAAKSSFYPLALVVGVLHIFDVDINISSNNWKLCSFSYHSL